MEGSHLMCAVDGSERAMAAVQFARDHLLISPCSRLAITTIAATHESPSNVFASGYPGNDKCGGEEQNIVARNTAKTELATNVLLGAAEECAKLRIAPGQIMYHGLPAVGGASGIAESLVQHTRLKEHVLLIMSTTGSGATDNVTRSTGLGTVSEYCIRNSPYATILVPDAPGAELAGDQGATAMKMDTPTRVCLCVDGSVLSASLLSFAVRHFPSTSGAELHLVCVAASQQLPVRTRTAPRPTFVSCCSMCVARSCASAAGCAAIHLSTMWYAVHYSQRAVASAILARQDGMQDPDDSSMEEATGAQMDVEQNTASAVGIAERVCSSSLEFLQGSGYVAGQLQHSVVHCGGGAADVAEAIAAYCRAEAITLCVLGSHGNGEALGQSSHRVTGLGSVSDSVVSKMPCALCVLRPQKWMPAPQDQQEQGTAGVSGEAVP